MGGAQAGEVASHLAVEVLEQGLPDGDGSVEERLRARVPRGQRADHASPPRPTTRAPAWARRSPSPTSARTTSRSPTSATAASTACATATFERLTDDHSLVEELVRQGKLTPEEADEHPAALDHHARAGRRGGRRGRQPHVGGARRRRLPDLLGRPDLDDPRGPRGPGPGRGAVAGRAPGACSSTRPTTPAGATTSRSSSSAWRRSARAAPRRRRPPSTARRRLGPSAERGRGRAATATASPQRAAAAPPPRRERHAPRRRRRRRAARPGRPDPRPLPAAPACSLGGYYASQTVYFVGASNDGFVSVYRGLPYDLPAGLHLYSVNYESGAPVDELTPAQKHTVTRTRCAPRTTRRTSSSSSRPGSWPRDDERAQPRAAGADPGLAAAHGGLRGRLHRAQRRADQRLADLRRDLPRPVPGGARRPALHAALRRPLPVPALRGAGVLRPRDDLPHRRRRWRASRRSGSSSGWASSPRRSSCCATTACSSATATRSRPSASGCCCCRACPASASRSTAPTSASRLGPLTFQPAEFAKIAIIVFLASYLRDTRQLLVIGARRFAGITIPPLKHFGPLLVVWGAAMLMLFFIQDLGSSLMFYGGFLAVALRGDQSLLVRRGRPRALRRRRVGPLPRPPDHHPPRRRVAASRSARSTTRSAAATRSRSPSSRRPTAASSGGASGRRC